MEKERKRYATTKSRRFHLGGSPGNVSSSGGGTNTNAISGSGIGLAPSSSSSSLLSDKYGILGPLQRRQMTAATGAQAKIDLTKPFDEYFRSLVKAGETVDSFEPLSADFYTKEINISTS